MVLAKVLEQELGLHKRSLLDLAWEEVVCLARM